MCHPTIILFAFIGRYRVKQEFQGMLNKRKYKIIRHMICLLGTLWIHVYPPYVSLLCWKFYIGLGWFVCAWAHVLL